MSLIDRLNSRLLLKDELVRDEESSLSALFYFQIVFRMSELFIKSKESDRLINMFDPLFGWLAGWLVGCYQEYI